MTDTQPQSLPAPAATSLQDFEPLLRAELVVLRAAARGDIAKVGYRQPHAPTPDVRLRAAFLAFMASGGDADAPVAGRSLQIMGACVIGRLDLTGNKVPMSLWFYRCSFVAAPLLARTRVRGGLSFADCALPGLRAEACRVEGDLVVNAGCRFDGRIDLARVRVEGDVDMSGALESVGEVRFIGALIGGDLRGQRRTPHRRHRRRRRSRRRAQPGPRAHRRQRHARRRLLGRRHGARRAGPHRRRPRLPRRRLRHRRRRELGRLRQCAAPGPRAHRRRAGAARSAGPLEAASLADARAGTLADDTGSWGQHHVLDGFTYTRFGAGSPTDAPTRLAWLARQATAHLDADYRPDPWRRAIQRAAPHRPRARREHARDRP